MPSIHDLTHQSGFVFEGQLERLGASTATQYPAVAETAIVHITRIIKSTPALAGYGGLRVTVHLRAPVILKEGEQAVFFTHGTHYGDGLVVAEIGHIVGGASNIAGQLSAAVQSSQVPEMVQRLAQADLVVSGVASAPRRHELKTATAISPRRISEHDPDWWVSTITIETVEKGVYKDKTTEAFFPNSMDIAWHSVRKIKQGDRGIWLLHNRDIYGKAVPGRALSHALDFRPAQDLDHVRSLLK